MIVYDVEIKKAIPDRLLPNIGEIRIATAIGKKGGHYFIWQP